MNDNEQIHRERNSSTLSASIAAELRLAILAGEYAPGTRIRQEELAERFGASRIPVREALKDLESQGLVTLVPNSGAWISRIDPKECEEIYNIRERLEPFALGLSVRRMSEAHIEHLSGLVSEIEHAASFEDFLRLDRRFHLESYADAGMPTLLSMIERFWNTTQHFRRAYAHLVGIEGQWVTHYEHRLLMDSVRRRDSWQAEQLLTVHIRRTRLSLNGAEPKMPG